LGHASALTLVDVDPDTLRAKNMCQLFGPVMAVFLTIINR